jgi:hypothetical protein
MTQYSKGQRSRDFPAPIARVTSDSPLWDWAAVARWLFLQHKMEREIAIEAAAVKAANEAIECHEAAIGAAVQRRLKAYEACLDAA